MPGGLKIQSPPIKIQLFNNIYTYTSLSCIILLCVIVIIVLIIVNAGGTPPPVFRIKKIKYQKIFQMLSAGPY